MQKNVDIPIESNLENNQNQVWLMIPRGAYLDPDSCTSLDFYGESGSTATILADSKNILLFAETNKILANSGFLMSIGKNKKNENLY